MPKSSATDQGVLTEIKPLAKDWCRNLSQYAPVDDWILTSAFLAYNLSPQPLAPFTSDRLRASKPLRGKMMNITAMLDIFRGSVYDMIMANYTTEKQIATEIEKRVLAIFRHQMMYIRHVYTRIPVYEDAGVFAHFKDFDESCVEVTRLCFVTNSLQARQFTTNVAELWFLENNKKLPFYDGPKPKRDDVLADLIAKVIDYWTANAMRVWSTDSANPVILPKRSTSICEHRFGFRQNLAGQKICSICQEPIEMAVPDDGLTEEEAALMYGSF